MRSVGPFGPGGGVLANCAEHGLCCSLPGRFSACSGLQSPQEGVAGSVMPGAPAPGPLLPTGSVLVPSWQGPCPEACPSVESGSGPSGNSLNCLGVQWAVSFYKVAAFRSYKLGLRSQPSGTRSGRIRGKCVCPPPLAPPGPGFTHSPFSRPSPSV